ncbi:hypothetical protein OK016_22345 [Vibrio chagasii]|nr:hypothetical protein [Vibrio chagasii]
MSDLSSAHGTNPATASMVSMKVVVVKCDEDGNIDMTGPSSEIEKHKDNLSSIMITTFLRTAYTKSK